METAETKFPRRLLARPWPERLEDFRTYTLAHPHIVVARDRLMAAIRGMEPNSLILVMGPTGVGKTTLARKVEQLLISEQLEDMRTDHGRMPAISVEAIAPESGNFNMRDFFRRLLLQGAEPLVDRKLKGQAVEEEGTPARPFIPGLRTTGLEYQYAVEQFLRYRRPAAVLIDDAQHLAIMASGRKLSVQLDVMKSIANLGLTIQVLFGTYGLLPFRNLSDQLSRRSMDIHLQRYRADDPEHWKIFLNVLRAFACQLPLQEPLDLVRHADYLYERSIGLVGVVKDWLMRTLAAVLEGGKTTLTLRDLERHALTVGQCKKILSEAVAGEEQMIESPAARAQLRVSMGLGSNHNSPEPLDTDAAKHNRPEMTSSLAKKHRPGWRQPKRDEIGNRLSSHAGTSRV